MTGFAETTTLRVPASYAFAFLADPSTARVIDPAIREYRPDRLPMGEGTRTLVRFRMWGIPVRAVSEVRVWEEGRRMVMENVKPAGPVRVIATHSFVPDGDSCRYTWAIELRPTGPLGRLVGPRFSRFMHANAKAQQDRLKHEVERRLRDERDLQGRPPS